MEYILDSVLETATKESIVAAINELHTRGVSSDNAIKELDRLKAPIHSPKLTGVPESVTPATADNSKKIATTEYVRNVVPTLNSATTDKLKIPVNIALSSDVSGTVSFDGSKSVTIVSTIRDGIRRAKTLSGGSNLNNLVEHGFHSYSAGNALVNAPVAGFCYVLVINNIDNALPVQWLFLKGGSDYWTRSKKSDGTWNAWRQIAYTDSPTFIGTPKAPTPAQSVNNTQIATTSYVRTAVTDLKEDLLGGASSAYDTLKELEVWIGEHEIEYGDLLALVNTKAPIISPTLTGVPKSPTAANDNNSTQIATTAFVKNVVPLLNSATTDKLKTAVNIALSGDVSGTVSFDGSKNVTITSTIRDGLRVAKNIAGGTNLNNLVEHGFHSYDTGAALVNAPTAGFGYVLVMNDNSNTQPTQVFFLEGSQRMFVRAKLSDGTWTAWGENAYRLSPEFTGTPLAPTPATALRNTQIATTAFVRNAMDAYNSATASKWQTARKITLSGDLTGNVTIDGSSDVTWSVQVNDDSHNHTISNVDDLQNQLNLRAPIASPTFTGTPKAPTAAEGNNSTQLATTAFVTRAVKKVDDRLTRFMKATLGTTDYETPSPTMMAMSSRAMMTAMSLPDLSQFENNLEPEIYSATPAPIESVFSQGVQYDETRNNIYIGGSLTKYENETDRLNIGNLILGDLHSGVVDIKKLRLTDLPTTEPLESGTIWNDQGILRIKE